ncbi:glycerol kinase [Sphingobium phenoxybenzoativorans]|uniref:Glycerol kinase n=1 Tax=Sphingobium phenoxybenzoativorans TaxID=1592790 RepID=A0A975K4J5_9SPHN|nr:glycerol kinase [Sphingobium phenoxybenzoativorans]QUT03993.1 glycerol kinase [Sphingobium phenoxybenzoativorans]
MNDGLLLVLDEGTTSTRAMLFDPAGNCLSTAQSSIAQHYPASGLVEQDAAEIWDKTLACARQVVGEAQDPPQIRALGITNQRETIVFWDRNTGQPLAPAIVWQDRRTADACNTLRDAGHEPMLRARTGLLLDPYFSASKIRWALDHWPALRDAGDRLAVGTMESYLIHRLTGGLHISDATNASRTALMDIHKGGWDDDLLALFGVDRRLLPEITDSHGRFGTVDPSHFGLPLPICGLAGDQQAAAIGQNCLTPGQSKATYGTGAFVIAPTGATAVDSNNRLLSTIARQAGGERHYALEGSIFVAGSLIQWLRDSLGLLGTAAETAELAQSVPDNGGVYLIPAMTGLGAPHWRPDVRGVLSGLSFGAGRAHIARAALEAMAYQTHDLQAAFAADGTPWTELRIDGGMAANDWMAQDIAGILDMPVTRPAFVETTAKGAAMLAAVGAGLFPALEDACEAMAGPSERFVPALDEETRAKRLAGWDEALAGVLRG